MRMNSFRHKGVGGENKENCGKREESNGDRGSKELEREGEKRSRLRIREKENQMFVFYVCELFII